MKVAIMLVVVATSLSGQNLMHPRAVAMGGAFTAIPEGVFSVSSNPANLGFPADYHSYFKLGGIHWQLTNNFYSLLTAAKYGGKDLSANNGELQAEFILDLPEDGWRMNNTLNLALPIVNFSTGNKAFTTNVLYTSDYYVSRPALDVIFGNIEKGTEYEAELRMDAMAAIEYAYSMGVPYENLAVGFSLKYYQGLGYYGLAPMHSSGTIVVDTAAFVLTGSGDYLFRQSGGGRGVGVDLGLTYCDKSGLDMGFCIQNIAARIKWNSPTLFSEGLGNSILGMMGDQLKKGIFKVSDLNLPFDGESYRYRYELHNIAGDELFEGDSSYSDFFYSSRTIIEGDSATFMTQIPLVLRMGIAKRMSGDLLMALDFSTSFRDRFHYNKGWRLSLGIEYTYLPKTPFRFGLSFGDISGWEVNLGSGLHLGFAHLDWAIGFHRGIWLHTTQGFHFTLGSYFTGKHRTR